MASISKRTSGAWQNTSYGIRATATGTITTLPTTIYGDGTNATISIKGNTVQPGTPTPDNPIMPQGTGERTENLIDAQPFTAEVGGGSTYISLWSGTLPVGDYTLSLNQDDTLTSSVRNCIRIAIGGVSYFESPTENYHNSSGIHTMRFTISNSTQAVELNYWTNNLSNRCTYSNIMLNPSSRALPYEPYGYKIPILSNGTTTPIYLGEVETTRRIKKLVLDGTETWSKGNYPPTGGYQFFTAMPADIATNSDWITTHFKNGIVLNGSILSSSAFTIYLSLYPEASILPENATINDFKAWIAAQYAAGTPVCVWYVLAEPETGIVNEPLMCIGDYADEVSGVSIPTTDGANTLSVDTTVQPSEVGVNYHGWHMGTVHERTSGEWD